jgi:hypothetical protein
MTLFVSLLRQCFIFPGLRTVGFVVFLCFIFLWFLATHFIISVVFSHVLANVNSPLDEVWFAAAVSISEILCLNCAALTLDFFNAWINAWEHLTPLEQGKLW